MSRVIKFDGAKESWQSTGLQANADEIFTVTTQATLPAGAMVEVRIGCHTDRLFADNIGEWRRFPMPVRAFSLENAVTPLASAFGGPILRREKCGQPRTHPAVRQGCCSAVLRAWQNFGRRLEAHPQRPCAVGRAGWTQSDLSPSCGRGAPVGQSRPVAGTVGPSRGRPGSPRMAGRGHTSYDFVLSCCQMAARGWKVA